MTGFCSGDGGGIVAGTHVFRATLACTSSRWFYLMSSFAGSGSESPLHVNNGVCRDKLSVSGTDAFLPESGRTFHDDDVLDCNADVLCLFPLFFECSFCHSRCIRCVMYVGVC